MGLSPRRVQNASAEFDIAVLKVAGVLSSQLIVPLGTAQNVRIGEEVIAIGTPLGFLQNTVSRGIVSGLREQERRRHRHRQVGKRWQRRPGLRGGRRPRSRGDRGPHPSLSRELRPADGVHGTLTSRHIA